MIASQLVLMDLWLIHHLGQWQIVFVPEKQFVTAKQFETATLKTCLLAVSKGWYLDTQLVSQQFDTCFCFLLHDWQLLSIYFSCFTIALHTDIVEECSLIGVWGRSVSDSSPQTDMPPYNEYNPISHSSIENMREKQANLPSNYFHGLEIQHIIGWIMYKILHFAEIHAGLVLGPAIMTQKSF